MRNRSWRISPQSRLSTSQLSCYGSFQLLMNLPGLLNRGEDVNPGLMPCRTSLKGHDEVRLDEYSRATNSGESLLSSRQSEQRCPQLQQPPQHPEFPKSPCLNSASLESDVSQTGKSTSQRTHISTDSALKLLVSPDSGDDGNHTDCLFFARNCNQLSNPAATPLELVESQRAR